MKQRDVPPPNERVQALERDLDSLRVMYEQYRDQAAALTRQLREQQARTNEVEQANASLRTQLNNLTQVHERALQATRDAESLAKR